MSEKEIKDITIPIVEDQHGNYYVSLSAVQSLAADVSETFMEQYFELMKSLSRYLDAAKEDDGARNLVSEALIAIGEGAMLPIMLAVLADPDGKRFDGQSYADIKEAFDSGDNKTGERSIH